MAKRFLSTIQGKDIAAYRDARLKKVGPNTVRNELAILSHLFTIAVKEWGMGGLHNPVQQIRKPAPPPGRDRRLHPNEEKILQAACPEYNAELSFLVRFALKTAMRRSELAGMTWDLVDIKKRTVTLPETKNGDKRIFPLSSEAIRILSGIPRRIDGRVWKSEANYFTLAFMRVTARARAFYEKKCEENGAKPDPGFLVDLTFHDLRHEATSRFFEKGLNPMQVAAITGHNFADVKKVYSPEGGGLGGVVKMSGLGKFREKILSGDSEANIHFDELCRFLLSLGFDRRIRGDHHIFTKDGVAEILNLQPKKGMATPIRSNRSETSLFDISSYQENKDADSL